MTSRFPARRIPGILALAGSSLIAATLVLHNGADRFHNAPAMTTVVDLLSPWALGAAFLVAGLTLLAACAWRRWWILNVGSGISLFLWTLICVSVLKAGLLDQVDVTPVEWALVWWMMVGQSSMLFAPLWVPSPKAPE